MDMDTDDRGEIVIRITEVCPMALAPYSHRKKMSLRQYLVVLGVMAAVLILAVAIRLMYGEIVLSTALTKDFLF